MIDFLPAFVYNKFRQEAENMIRKAQKKDISRLAEIEVFGKRVAYRPIFQDDNGSFNEIQVGNIIEEYRQNPEWLAHIRVYDDGIVKGILNWKDYCENGRTDEIELFCFYVEPFFKGQGIGRELLRNLFDEAERRHKKRIYAWVLKENASARRFYERNGFAADGREGLVEGTTAFHMCYVRELDVLWPESESRQKQGGEFQEERSGANV